MKSVLTFHAEMLHDERVWRRLKGVARWMGRRGWKTTFFVYPFRAMVAGKEIADRVQTLAQLGHEIGQHTHFYSGIKIDRPDKVDDFSDANVAHCLRRDFEFLSTTGAEPKGFTAGGWVVTQQALDTLADLGFVYDCSSRFPKPGGISASPYHRWVKTPQFHLNSKRPLLCLPTTCSLGEWFRWGRRTGARSSASYQLVYLHDYDLVSLRNYLLLWTFLTFAGRAQFVSAGMLAGKLLEKGMGS